MLDDLLGEECEDTIADLQARLSAAEEVVEAAKGLVIDNDGWCYRCEKEQTHGDNCPLPRLIDAIRQYEEGR